MYNKTAMIRDRIIFLEVTLKDFDYMIENELYGPETSVEELEANRAKMILQLNDLREQVKSS